jgi:hypothetical protein
VSRKSVDFADEFTSFIRLWRKTTYTKIRANVNRGQPLDNLPGWPNGWILTGKLAIPPLTYSRLNYLRIWVADHVAQHLMVNPAVAKAMADVALAVVTD